MHTQNDEGLQKRLHPYLCPAATGLRVTRRAWIRVEGRASPLTHHRVFKSAIDHITEFSNMSLETAQAIRK